MKRKLFSKILAIVLSLCTLTSCALNAVNMELADPLKKSQVSAIWFSYLDYQELAYDASAEEFAHIIDDVIANCTQLGINTIYVHASAFTDAFYQSAIYPKTTLMGNLSYDPLAVFVSKAHENNIRIEAWINPLRSVTTDETDLIQGTVLEQWINDNSECIRPVDGRYYLNPAYPEVRELICSIVGELLDNYDIDGIHLDDYFYPNGTENKFDSYIYDREYQKSLMSREVFRRNAINALVKEIHDTVKSRSQFYSFGISVAGNNDNNINIYFADPAAWIKAGTIDYLIPQIYWGFEHPVKPYEETLQKWYEMVDGTTVQMYAGLAAYKIGTEDYYAGSASDEWITNTDMIARQINTAFACGCEGFAIFRYASLYSQNVENPGNVEKEIINIKNSISASVDLSEK